MKTRMLFLCFSISACIGFGSLAFSADPRGNTEESRPIPFKTGDDFEIKKNITPEEARVIIQEQAKEAILDLKRKDFKKLSKYVHPEKGVVIGDVNFNIRQLRYIERNKTKRFHVVLGGEGDDAYFDFNEYYRHYLYDRDYVNAPETNYNKYCFLYATKKCWLYETYPDSIVVQYYFPDSNPRNTIDRKSLALVFEKANNSKWYIVKLFHDEWSP